MRVLLLSYTEPGELSTGPAIILTNMVAEFRKQPGIDIRIGLLKGGPSDVTDVSPCPADESLAFRLQRGSQVRSVMLRAALGGPLTAGESAFLRACGNESKHCQIAVWLGLSWDPVSLKLPQVCSCPVVHHPTDSIAWAEITRLPGVAQSLRIRIARNLEARVLKSGYVKSIYNSPQDSRHALSLLPVAKQSQIVTLPIGVNVEAFHPARVKTENKRIRVIFSGVMLYRPNVDAALTLVRDVLPHIRADVEVWIVGRNPTPEVTDLSINNARVIVTGAVPDVADELRKSDIFVAPMVSGGGISNKVLEALACGLPVVATPLVADNFPDRPGGMLVAKTSKDIASAIDGLAHDRELRSRLASEATEYIRTGNWSWQSRAERLIELLRESAGQ